MSDDGGDADEYEVVHILELNDQEVEDLRDGEEVLVPVDGIFIDRDPTFVLRRDDVDWEEQEESPDA